MSATATIQTGASVKRYIILNQGTEYNDSTYDIGGDASVVKNAFQTKEDALKEASVKLLTELNGFRIYDFEQYPDWRIRERFERETRGGNRAWDAKWSEFVEWCVNNDIDWKRQAPPLLQVFEIEIE